MTINNLKNVEKCKMRRISIWLPVIKGREIKMAAAAEGMSMSEFVDRCVDKEIRFLKEKK